MSSQLIELLTTSQTINKNKLDIKNNKNFILELIKQTEPQKAIDLLKNLNLTKEEIKELISKLPAKDKKLYLNLLNKKNKINLENVKIQNNSEKQLKNSIENLLKLIQQKTPLNKNEIKTINNKNTHQKTSDNLSSNTIENILNLLLNNTQTLPLKIKKEINSIKQDITKLIKKQIEVNTTIENKLITKKTIKEIKNTNSFEELISVANKNGLNIKKIISKIIKQQKPKNLQQPPQIKISNLKIIQNKINLNSSTAKLKSHIDNNDKDILQILISNKSSHTKITTQNKTDNLISDETNYMNNKNKKNNIDIKIINYNPTIEIQHKIIKAKESIKHFSNSLKEVIKNYKPPISRLSIELHPKELGKIEVTLIHRGDNLQININSNNQAINFFHSHQIELKNTLINMGYNGIDMNFNSNQNQNQGKKAYKQSYSKKEENYDELIIEIPYTYA